MNIASLQNKTNDELIAIIQRQYDRWDARGIAGAGATRALEDRLAKERKARRLANRRADVAEAALRQSIKSLSEMTIAFEKVIAIKEDEGEPETN